MKPTLAIVFESGFPGSSFREFADVLNSEALAVHMEERPPQGPLAGIMWTMLTGAALFIASSYFSGILKEVGKDHYELLKKALAKLTEKTMEIPRVEPVLIGTVGKGNRIDPISMAFSVWVEMPSGRTFKLLIPKKTDKVDYCATTNAFLDFVMCYYEDGEGVLADTGFDISRRQGNPITVIYNPETGKIEWADPIAK